MRLEERQPEQLSIGTSSQMLANIFFEVVVHNVLHIHSIQIVSPRVEHLEAFVLDLLFSVPFDIVLQELKGGLVGLDGVAQVVIVDGLLVVSQERSNGLDAGGALKVLAVDLLFNELFQVLAAHVAGKTQNLHDSHHGALETLKVPVLIDDLVDDSGLEDLLYLVSEEEHQVVQLRNLLVVVHVLGQVLGNQLLKQQVDEGLEVLVGRHLQVLFGELDVKLDPVGQRSANGLH